MAQLALCIRYTKQGVIKERLVDLVDVSKGKSAIELSTAMKDSLSHVIKEATKVIGQSYDGAANMAGVNNLYKVKSRMIGHMQSSSTVMHISLR